MDPPNPPNIPIGSNFLTDPLIGPAIGIDAVRGLYHAALAYNGVDAEEHKKHMYLSLAEIALLIGDYFAGRAEVDALLQEAEAKKVDESVRNKTGLGKGGGIMVARVLFVDIPILIKTYYQARYSFLPMKDKTVDLVADLSVLSLLVARQAISSEMTTNAMICNSTSGSSNSHCPVPSPMKPFSFNFLSPLF
jgi:hypothetical protein